MLRQMMEMVHSCQFGFLADGAETKFVAKNIRILKILTTYVNEPIAEIVMIVRIGDLKNN
mgnify:CR=1 FL=1